MNKINGFDNVMGTKLATYSETANNSSSSEIKIFENTEFGKVRTILIDGEPWFSGRDIALILEPLE